MLLLGELRGHVLLLLQVVLMLGLKAYTVTFTQLVARGRERPGAGREQQAREPRCGHACLDPQRAGSHALHACLRQPAACCQGQAAVCVPAAAVPYRRLCAGGGLSARMLACHAAHATNPPCTCAPCSLPHP